jgi:putative hemolysin
MTILIIIFICLLSLSGFFSASETALFSLSKIERKRIAEASDWRSKSLNSLITHPSKTLSTVLIGNMLVNTALTCLFTLYALTYHSHEWLGFGLIVFTAILLLFGEVLPKNIALSLDVRLAYFLAPPVTVCAYIFNPAIIALLHATRFFVKKVSKGSSGKMSFSEDEIKTLIEIGREEGVVADDEVKRLANIFSFGDRKVKEIMVPRTDMISCDIEAGRQHIEELVREKKCRYVVVYRDTIDTVVGVVFTRELLLHPELPLKLVVQRPLYIPEIQKMDAYVTNMIIAKYDCAVCVDEFGGTAGVISHDEIINFIFGRLHEREYEPKRRKRVHLKENEYIVDATISLYELNALLKLDPGFNTEHYDSLSGFILGMRGEIPRVGEKMVCEGVEIIIKSMVKNRIEKVVVRPYEHK